MALKGSIFISKHWLVSNDFAKSTARIFQSWLFLGFWWHTITPRCIKKWRENSAKGCRQGIISSEIGMEASNEFQAGAFFFCILNTISLALTWTCEPSEWLAFCTEGKKIRSGFCPCSSLPGFKKHLLSKSNRSRDECLIVVWTWKNSQPWARGRCVNWEERRKI